jgi:hypothetical protein
MALYGGNPMNQRITDALITAFSTHAVVFWHDADGEFSFSVKNLLPDGIALVSYDEKLRHYPDMRITLDFDDDVNVNVNYSTYGDLLAEVKAVTGGSGDE